jgi:pyrophosphatase PpaX
VVVGADSVTKHKPAPEPVLLALELLQVRADEAVFVGDSPHDVHAGNAAGVDTIAALWGPFSREQLVASTPTYLLDSLGALPALLATR